MSKKKREIDKSEMVLYRCPYCGLCPAHPIPVPKPTAPAGEENE